MIKKFKQAKLLLICPVVVGMFFSASSCITMRTNDKKFTRQFQKKGLAVDIQHMPLPDEGTTLRYILSQKYRGNLPLVIFIHGAPGSSDNFNNYLKDSLLNLKTNMISLDRLGYGFSNFGSAESSITKQAAVVSKVIGHYNNPNTLVVGWSYGGPIAAKAALNQPTLIKHVIMLAPAIDPKAEKYFWLGKLAEWHLTKWMVPKPLLVAQKEKRAHAKELEQLVNEWHEIKIPVTHVHGDNDILVPYRNIDFSRENFSANIIRPMTIKGAGHLFPISKSDYVKKLLIAVITECVEENQQQ